MIYATHQGPRTAQHAQPKPDQISSSLQADPSLSLFSSLPSLRSIFTPQSPHPTLRPAICTLCYPLYNCYNGCAVVGGGHDKKQLRTVSLSREGPICAFRQS